MNQQNWFVKDSKGRERTGVLMKLEEDEHSRYIYEIWFEYTRKAMNEIREGTMLAVPNYATARDETHYSIIEVTSIKPIHYAIGESPSGFPGFVLEAARNAAKDWTGQDDESTEDTTTITCTAIPTNLELVETEGQDPRFRPETNIPMVGASVRILDTYPTSQVVNRDIDLEKEKHELFVGGTLIRDEQVRAHVRIEDFVKVHFGVFGFTGTGKSNILSMYISYLLDAPRIIKIVLFDLMGEYTPLLIDLLNELDSARVICVGRRTLPEPVFQYLNSDAKRNVDPSEPAIVYSKSSLLPKALKPLQVKMTVALKLLLQSDKVRVYEPIIGMTVYDIFYADRQSLAKLGGRLGSAKFARLKELIKRLAPKCEYSATKLTPQLLDDILVRLLEEKTGQTKDYKDFQDYLDPFERWLRTIRQKLEQPLNCGVDLDAIVHDLEDPGHSSLFVITSHDPHELRRFAKSLGELVYESRRVSGKIEPLASFIFDEADEFIPNDNSGTYPDSREIAETLARRGRKFGLGLGIATQRTRYLDTSIMSQPHTYLVSKMPRKSDREVITEAFGVSEDMFRQTFKFMPGDWLLMSYDATGLKAVPVPIHAENANRRIEKYLEAL